MASKKNTIKAAPKKTSKGSSKSKRDSNNASHDSFLKKIMENPVAAIELLDEYLPADFKENIDLSTLTIEKESYVEESLKRRLSDIVYSTIKFFHKAGNFISIMS